MWQPILHPNRSCEPFGTAYSYILVTLFTTDPHIYMWRDTPPGVPHFLNNWRPAVNRLLLLPHKLYIIKNTWNPVKRQVQARSKNKAFVDVDRSKSNTIYLLNATQRLKEHAFCCILTLDTFIVFWTTSDISRRDFVMVWIWCRGSDCDAHSCHFLRTDMYMNIEIEYQQKIR